MLDFPGLAQAQHEHIGKKLVDLTISGLRIDAKSLIDATRKGDYFVDEKRNQIVETRRWADAIEAPQTSSHSLRM